MKFSTNQVVAAYKALFGEVLADVSSPTICAALVRMYREKPEELQAFQASIGK